LKLALCPGSTARRYGEHGTGFAAGVNLAFEGERVRRTILEAVKGDEVMPRQCKSVTA
jgi:hypothetical protein